MKNAITFVATLCCLTPLFGACVEGEDASDDLELAVDEQDVTTGAYTCGRYLDLSNDTTKQLYNFTTGYVNQHDCDKVSTVPYTGSRNWLVDVRWNSESLPPDGRCTGSFQIATLRYAVGSQWVADRSSITQGKVVTNSTTGVQYCEYPRVLWALSPNRQYLVEASNWLNGERRGTRIEYIP